MEENFQFQLPANVIPGSSRGSISVLGKSAWMSFCLSHSYTLLVNNIPSSESLRLPPIGGGMLCTNSNAYDENNTTIHFYIIIKLLPCYTWYHAGFFVLSEVMFFCPGDIMGRAMKNVDNLLRMPYGCGEQNMALLAPNIYILQYLKNTDQLTPAIKEKSDRFLTSGGCLITLWQYYNK